MTDTLSQIIAATEERYEKRTDERERRAHHVEQIRQRGAGNWRMIDEPKRVMRRLLSEGLTDAVSEAMAATSTTRDEAAPEEAPFFDALERIIEKNELMSSSFLRHGAASARSVGRVVLRSPAGHVVGFGTGFLVSPRLLLTNNHVLASREEARRASVQFNYLQPVNGHPVAPLEFAFEPSTLFETDRPLDFTLLAVDETSADGTPLDELGWNPLIGPSGKAIVGERVNVIQHPGGEPQQLALRQNEIVDVPDNFLHYATDTNRGSSGAPVFNDQWEVAALHHSGVPRRENGRIMLVTGVPWDGSDVTAGQIHWVANEGVRISRIVDELEDRAATMTADERALFEAAFEPCDANRHWPEEVVGPEVNGRRSTATDAPRDGAADGRGKGRMDEQGYAYWSVPLEVRVGLATEDRPAPRPRANGARPTAADRERPDATGRRDATTRPTVAEPPSGPDEQRLQRALDRVTEGRRRVYYDADADDEARGAYYSGIDQAGDGRTLFDQLHQRLKESHTAELSYSSARLDFLYPWIDLRQDVDGTRALRSIYSGKGFRPEEMIREDLSIEATRQERLREFVATESVTEEAVNAFLKELESDHPFNCEHVVPQSWFGKMNPMRTDLHHLFTCEPNCNSFRSNIPYYEFAPEDEAFRTDCGRRAERRKFEPVAGKGPVARATLYFLLRYPGLTGDAERELQHDRLPVLFDWHRRDPVTTYERHRNAAIAEVQGNRNPLIDHPEWADHLDFDLGLGRPVEARRSMA